MWRTYVAVFLLVGTLAVGFVMHHYTASQAKAIAEQIPVSLSEPQGEEALSGAYERFQSRSSVFSTFYVHTLLREIEEAFQDCFSYQALGLADEYATQAAMLRFLLQDLCKTDDMSLANIL